MAKIVSASSRAYQTSRGLIQEYSSGAPGRRARTPERLPGPWIGQLVIACNNSKSDGQPLEIPFPWRGECFVKVVQIKDQIALQRGFFAARYHAVPYQWQDVLHGRRIPGQRPLLHHERRSFGFFDSFFTVAMIASPSLYGFCGGAVAPFAVKGLNLLMLINYPRIMPIEKTREIHHKLL
jgi:hypothetical protein